MLKLPIWLMFIFLPFTCYSMEKQLYGVNIHANKYNLSADDILKKIQDTGFNSFRQEISWASTEKEPKQFKIQGINVIKDEMINEANNYKIEPILILSYGNPLYNKGDFPVTNDSIEGFVDYASWLAKKYKGKVNTYEVWNEWTLGTGMKNKDNIPAEKYYLELVIKTSQALKSIDPNIKVIAGSFNPLSPSSRRLKYNDTQWFSNLIDMGILNYIDGVSIHPYSFLNVNMNLRTVEGNYAQVISLEHKIRERAKLKTSFPIYITEVGVSNFLGPGGVSDKSSSDFIIKYTAMISTLPYIKGIWWYDLIDDGINQSEKEENFGFYTNTYEKKYVVNNFKELVEYIKTDSMISCEVNISSEKVQFTKKNGYPDSKCSSIEWKRIPFMQYNRLSGEFNECINCDNFEIKK